MGDELAELENRLTDFLYEMCNDISTDSTNKCVGISCKQCPIYHGNARITARGFLRELVWERRDWMVE